MNRVQKYKTLINRLFISLIGITFLVSGIGKVLDITVLEQTIQEYLHFKSFWIISLLVVSICFVEIIIGFELLLLYKVKRNLLVVTILTIVFTISFTYGILFLDINKCYCFGLFPTSFFDNNISYYIKNFVIITASIILLKHNTFLRKYSRLESYVVKSFIISLAFLMGTTSNLKFGGINSSEERNTNSNALFDYYNFSKDSTYFVFVFSYSCPHCINSVENVKEYNKANYIDKVVYITYQADSTEKSVFRKNFCLTNDIIELPFKEVAKFTTRFPSGYYIINNEIQNTIYGLMPAELLLRNEIFN